MAKGDNSEVNTFTVLASRWVARADGRAAIVLETHIGPIAFEVNEAGAAALRRSLEQLEQFLRQQPGQG